MRAGITLLEPPARDHAARPDRGAAGPQAQEPGRLDAGPSPLAGEAAQSRRRHPGIDQDSEGSPADSHDDARRVDAGATGRPALRPAARRPPGARDPLPPDLAHDRPDPAPGARPHEGLGMDRRAVVLRLLVLW